MFGPGIKDGATKIKVMDIKNKFHDIEAISMGSSESLVISFHGFESREDMREFNDFVFAKIRMRFQSFENPPTIH